MHDIFCPNCNQRYLIGSSSIDSFHNTSEGPIAYVRCPQGHHLMRNFRSSQTSLAQPTTPEAIAS